MICDNGTEWSGISFTPTADVDSNPDVHAQEIDAMSEDEIDASVPDSVAARGEELVKVKATSSPANDLLLSVLTGHTEVFKAGMKAQKELDK